MGLFAAIAIGVSKIGGAIKKAGGIGKAVKKIGSGVKSFGGKVKGLFQKIGGKAKGFFNKAKGFFGNIFGGNKEKEVAEAPSPEGPNIMKIVLFSLLGLGAVGGVIYAVKR